MYIAIEGPTLGFDDILMNAIVLWKMPPSLGFCLQTLRSIFQGQ
jgi:hypothetical protein